MEHTLTGVSRVAHNEYRSETHFSITGYPFYQGTSVPSVSPQPETIPFPTCPPLVPTPPVPTNSFCSRCLPITYWDKFTQWLPPALPFSTDRYAAPTTPSPSYARSHMPGPDDPPLGFPAGEESFSLPAALSTQVYNLFCEQRTFATSHSSDWTPVPTIRDSAWHQNQFPGFDPFDLDISPFAGIRVSDFVVVVVVSLIHSRDCAGCHPTRSPPSPSRGVFVWPPTDQAICEGGAKIRPSQAGEEPHVAEERLEPHSR